MKVIAVCGTLLGVVLFLSQFVIAAPIAEPAEGDEISIVIGDINTNGAGSAVSEQSAASVPWSSSPTHSIPEPATAVMIGVSLISLGMLSRRRKQEEN